MGGKHRLAFLIVWALRGHFEPYDSSFDMALFGGSVVWPFIAVYKKA